MANILILSALQVFPTLSGGHQRTALIATGLAKAGHNVRVYSLIGRKKEMLRGLGATEATITQGLVESVERPKLLWLRAMVAYRRGIPPVWAAAHLNRQHKMLSRLLADSDVVIFDFPYTFSNICSSRQLTILNSHNVETDLFKAGDPGLSELVRAVEEKAALGVQAISCASKVEEMHFSRLNPRAAIFHIPNIVDPQRFQQHAPNSRDEIRARLGIAKNATTLFFPASRYGPNEQGFAFIRDFTMKNAQLLEELNITFLVVGSVTRSPIQSGRLVATGPVAKIEPYFNAADWGFNPIFDGSGTSIKVAEMIAARLPLLTTRVGARGFTLDDQMSAIFFEAETLPAILANLPREGAKLTEMTAAAKAANRQFFDPTSATQPLLDIIAGRN